MMANVYDSVAAVGNVDAPATETHDRWSTTPSTRPDMIFQEVNAFITPGYFHQTTNEPEVLLNKLNTEIGVKVEKINLLNGQYQFILRGALDQIVLSKIKLEAILMEKQMNHLNNAKPPTVLSTTNNDGVHKNEIMENVTFTSNSTLKTNYARSRRKVCIPRKVSIPTINQHTIYEANVQIFSPVLPTKAEMSTKEINISKNESFDDNPPPSQEPNENAKMECELSPIPLSLEEEAERKANEWLSVPKLSEGNGMIADDMNMKIPTSYIYSCELCSFKAHREGQFLKHVLTHSKRDTVHQCKKCSFASVSLSHYNRHQLSHSDATFTCPECDFTTDDPKLLARHVAVKHTYKEDPLKRSSLLQCNDCPYNTTKIYHFERHLLVHNRDLKGLLQVHQCDQCPYKTHRKEHIIRHRHNVHIRHRPYSCNSCHRTYKNLESLHHHQLTHMAQPEPIQT